MSKSLGNLVTPSQLIAGPASSSPSKGKQPPKTLLDKAWPVDVLRLWVAASDYTYDVSLGVQQLLKVQETYQKIRNTNRYLLSNLYDYDVLKNRMDYSMLSIPDKWCLSRLFSVSQEIRNAYDHFAFTDVYVFFHSFFCRYRSLTSFTVTDLSATYFDIVKDRLYTDSPNSPRRRATQTVLYNVLQTLPRLIAPITPFLAEEIYSSMQKDAAKSVFEDGYYEMKKEWDNPSITSIWSIDCGTIPM